MNKELPVVINLFAGPSSGKSTKAAEVFAEFKKAGVNCELVTEFAKDLVWSENFEQLKDQIFIFGNYYHRFWRLIGKVDVIITDSPLLMGLVYTSEEEQSLKNLVVEKHFAFPSLNYYVDRVSDYIPIGRTQTKEEAEQKDLEIKRLLEDHGVEYNFTNKSACPSVILRDYQKILER